MHCFTVTLHFTLLFIFIQDMAGARKKLLLAAEEGRLQDVQSLIHTRKCKVDDEDEVRMWRVCEFV